MNPQGQPEDITGDELIFNFFPDAKPVGYFTSSGYDENTGAYTWTGYFVDIEYSYFYVVYVGGVYHFHGASPLGVYEATLSNGDVYKIIEIEN